MNSPRSIKGQQMYEFLPDLYREQDVDTDPAKPHLKAYLDAHGALLDRVRATLEQLYGDHFPDVPAEGRVCQEWIIPYLAALVGFDPVSPFPDGQRTEVANAIRWNQRKGTRLATDEIAEAIVLNEIVVQEGWQRVLRTADLDTPLLPAISFGELDPSSADASDDNGIDGFYQDSARRPGAALPELDPQLVARHPGHPTFTLNINQSSRAFDVEDEVLEYTSSDGSTINLKLKESLTSQTSRFGGGMALWPGEDQPYRPNQEKEIPWIQHFRNGVPCFPDSYEDVSRRSVDMHLPQSSDKRGYYHPKRALIFMPPPRGMCADVGSTNLSINVLLGRLNPDADDSVSDGGITASKIIADDKTTITIQGDPLEQAPKVLTGTLKISDGQEWHLEHVRFKGVLKLEDGAVELHRCVVQELNIIGSDEAAVVPSVKARDCLFETISGEKLAILEAEYCTILKTFSFPGFVWASEVIFPEFAETLEATFECVRFSRVPAWMLKPPPEGAIAKVNRSTNTSVPPVFVEIKFCQPGAGVLAPDCSEAITKGAENGGEMGAYHAWRFIAQREALRLKLKDYLPLGIEPVIIWDKRLLCAPPRKKAV